MKKEQPQPQPKKPMLNNVTFGSWNGYQIYEWGHHILVSKMGRTHLLLEEHPSGMVANYQWEDHKWTPKFKFEDQMWSDLKTEKDVYEFIKTHRQLW